MKNLKEFKPLLKFIKEDKGKIIFASILIFTVQFTEILEGYLNGSAIEEITKLHLKKSIMFLGIYLILRIVFDCIIEVTASSMLRKVETKLTSKLGYKAYVKALDLPAYAYEEKSSGEIINRITNDSGTLSNTFTQLLHMVSSLIGSIIVLFYIFYNSWIVGLEIVLFMVILFFVVKKYNPMLKQIHKNQKKEGDKVTSLVNESIRGIREIKTLGIKKSLITDLRDMIKELLTKKDKEVDISKRFNRAGRTLRALIEVGVFITCVILLYYKQTTLTFVIAMTTYIYRYMWLIEYVNSFSETYQRVIVSITRINEIIENRLFDDEQFGTNEIKDSKGIVEFRNVTFSYPNEDIILKDFNLVLEPHKKIAIVGKSGQGKSTLFNLLTRVFDPVKGEILLDGVDIKTLTEDELRKQISIIRQEPFIFNRTIKENFKLVDKDITIDEIRNYTKKSYLDDYIMELPDKYDTKLGEGGVNLSGGQKQRLAIARTLAKESKVILFDEATSSLDNNSQNYVKKAIDNLVKNHTVIIVAHRLSTIVDADIIYVVEKGKVVDSGTHKQLLKSSPTYKKLYENEDI